MANYGFIYVCHHDLMPDVYKIGYTDRAPMQRIDELSASTSIPSPFELVCYAEFSNAQAMEAYLHKDLANYRISQNREFFKLPLYLVVNNLNDWFLKSAINYTKCIGFYTLQGRHDEFIDMESFEDSPDEKEKPFTNEVIDKANEIINTASSDGGQDA